MPLEQQLPQAMQGREAELRGPVGQRFAFLGGLAGAGDVAPGLQQGHGMNQFHQPAHERKRLDAKCVKIAHGAQQGGRLALQQQRQQPAHRSAVGQAQHLAHLCGRDQRRALAHFGVRDRLIEDREPVARRPFGRLGDQRQRIGFGRDAFRLDHMGEMSREQIRRDAAQIETLASRQNRHRHLVHLGRGEQELHMRRRLFQRLQQGVEGVLGEHMDFVDDVDLVARRHGGIAHGLNDFAHVVHAGMAGGVHFHHVDMAAFGNCPAGFADAAGVDGRAALPVRADAVQGFCDQARGRRLADAAHPGHQKGMRQSPAPDRIAQRLDHSILPDEFAEAARSIFARQDAIGLG